MNGMSTRLVAMLLLLALPEGCTDDEAIALDEESTLAADEESLVNCSVVWEKELMITDVAVVTDWRAKNMGPWSFGGLMQSLAGPANVQAFVKRFVESWMVDQTIDGVVVKARPKMQDLVLGPWKARSAPGTYDLATAPFDLLAIVYRVDLRKQQNTGTGAGEGRFVYGVRDGSGQPMPFTVIAEFKLPIYGGKTSRDWANDWHALGTLTLGSEEYKERLEYITNQFAGSTVRAGLLPSSLLNQLRTNEIALDFGTDHPPIWQLREFHIKADGYLYPARPALTPTNAVNGSTLLKTYVQQNAAKIMQGTHKIPPKFQGIPFGASGSDVPDPQFSWQVPGVSIALQDAFSKQTCNGCHAGNTGTTFLHVGPNFQSGPAQLSDFVVNVEMPRRTAELKKVLGCPK